MSKKENLTKTYIYKAFTQLLEKKHFDDISVCDIAEKAGVSRMSFYRNFASKEDLFFKGIANLFQRMHDEIPNKDERTQYMISKTLFETFRPYKNCIASFENSNISKTFTDLVMKKISEDIPGDYMSKTSKYIPVFFIGAISATLLQWLKTGAEEEPEEMAKLIASLIDDI